MKNESEMLDVALARLTFLPPDSGGGTEGGVKTIEEPKGCKKKFVDSIFFYTFVRKFIKINKTI